jgi:hypothetical protein
MDNPRVSRVLKAIQALRLGDVDAIAFEIASRHPAVALAITEEVEARENQGGTPNVMQQEPTQ